MVDWFRANETLIWWMAGSSIAVFVGSLIAVPIVVLRLPADYFSREQLPEESWRKQHPAACMILKVLKNLCGYILVLAGLIMSIPPIPGQGLLTIMIGLSLLDFPGKREIELKFLRLKPVKNSFNWIRGKGNKPPLEIL